MYYKVVYNNRVIDVLDNLTYLKYQSKHNRMVLCDKSMAQAIFSSDKQHIWHVEGLPKPSTDKYDTVVLEKIDKYEYLELNKENIETSSSRVIDNFILELSNGNIGQLAESLKRLFLRKEINEIEVIKLCDMFHISENLKKDILGN